MYGFPLVVSEAVNLMLEMLNTWTFLTTQCLEEAVKKSNGISVHLMEGLQHLSWQWVPPHHSCPSHPPLQHQSPLQPEVE